MMRSLRSIPPVLLVLAIALGACTDDDADSNPTPREPIELTRSGACGDAFFWAETESGDVAVTVIVDAFERAADAPTTIEINLPDPAINVDILTGQDLSTNFCTDVIEQSSEPMTRVSGVAGTGEIVLEPANDANDCGSTTGTLRLEGLTTGNGTTFTTINVTSEMIGCYAG